MIPTYMNSSSSRFPFDLNYNYQDQNLQLCSGSLSGRDEIKYEMNQDEKNNPEKMERLIKKVEESIMIRFDDHHPKGPSPSPSYSSETHHSSNSSSSINGGNVAIVRVCADCKTTKTPLWRSGPKGPKSLCNACGIRQRKARQATGSSTSGTTGDPLKTVMKSKKNHLQPVTKGRCKSNKEHGGGGGGAFEDFLKHLNKSLETPDGVFTEDEKDAAILLMAISCGVVNAAQKL